jgi:hypothetical protein
MFGPNFNPDELKEALGSLKEKIQVTKDDDGVLLIFTDPDAAADPMTQGLLNPEGFEGLKNMAGGGSIEFTLEPVDGGVKFMTSDPDGLYDILQKVLDPDFMLDMINQLMAAFTGPGGLADQLENLGNELEGVSKELSGLEGEVELPKDRPDEDTQEE